METSVGRWGACRGYEDACDEDGTQTRQRFICQNGNEVGVQDTQGCLRDTDGVQVSVGDWTGCGGFDGACDEWWRTRDRVICQNGNESALLNQRLQPKY